MSLSRSLDLPALDRVDTLAQELALLQDKGKRRIAILGSRHVPVVAIHLVELICSVPGARGAYVADLWLSGCERSRDSGCCSR